MPGSDLTLKRGDTGPAFRAQCLDGTTGVDLTSASGVRLLMAGPATLTLPLTKESGTAGWVGRAWAATDLAVAGAYRAEVEVTWSDGKVQTFPAGGYATVTITSDLG